MKLKWPLHVQKAVAILFPLLLVAYLWWTDTPTHDNFIYEVDHVTQIPWLETPWLYTYIHIFTVVPILFLSFDRRVHYYTRWKYLLPAIAIVGILFIIWDIFFTVQHVWEFNPIYYYQKVKLYGLPLEEWFFFVSVPFACAFIYECLNYYVKKDVLAGIEKPLTFLFIIVFWIVGLLHLEQLYTATTFILAGGFVLYHYLFLTVTYRSRFYLSYFVSLIPFLIVNGVLTGGYTNEPVVIYNPEEYLGIRIISVPLDDSVYGFLLLFGVITLYEYFKPTSIVSPMS